MNAGRKRILKHGVGVGFDVEAEQRDQYASIAAELGMSFSAWAREALELYAQECLEHLERMKDKHEYEREIGLRD